MDQDGGEAFVLFAAGEVMQESVLFIPADKVFEHKVQGPLKVLQEVGNPRTVA